MVKELRFTVCVIAGNNNECVLLDEICSADGERGRRLILAHLQGDSRTDFSISFRRNAVVKFQLNQPFYSVLADSLCQKSHRTVLNFSLGKVNVTAFIHFGKRHGR